MWAIITLCVYGIGTPVLFLAVLGHYRKEIKVDQVLRKSGLGYTRASNPHFTMRRRCVHVAVGCGCAFRVEYRKGGLHGVSYQLSPCLCCCCCCCLSLRCPR